MNRLLIIALILFNGWNSIGQIILDQTDLPQVGDLQIVYLMDSASSSNVAPGIQGTNKIWDYSSLTPNSMDTITYVSPSSTPKASLFPGATLARYSKKGNKYEYHISATAGLKYFGADENQGVKLVDISCYEFPVVQYGNSVTHLLRYRYNIINATNYSAEYVSQYSDADSWGKITTPAGTVQAIRIYTTEARWDSTYVNGVGIQNYFQTGYYFTWYAKNLGWPVLMISKGILTNPSYRIVQYAKDLSSVPFGIIKTGDDYGISIYPNPSTGKIGIEGRNHFNSLEVYNLVGEKIYESELTGSALNEIDLSTQPKGSYLLKINTGEKFISKLIMLQ